VRAWIWAYQALGAAGLAAASPVVALRALGDPRYRTGWGERLGGWADVPPGGVWVHGASVGELRAAAPLVLGLLGRDVPVVVSATSPAGRDTASELVGQAGAARLLPLDLLPLVSRAFARARPRALVLVETELWPGLLWEARRRQVPVLLVNARISDRALPRYRRLRPFVRSMLSWVSAVQAQSEAHARRLLDLGAPPDRVEVGGNLKFDLPEPDPADPVARALRRSRAGGWRVVVAGSTHPGEEEALVRAVAGLARVGLVVAPRHLERLAEAEEEIRRAGREVVRWSALGEPLEAGILGAFGAGRVIVVDAMGLLPRLYGGARCAFVGGTLAPVGGHNPLEALVWGVPVIVGPHTANIREFVAEILERSVGTRVDGPEGLGPALEGYLEDPEARDLAARAARALFAEHRGATQRALRALDRIAGLRG